MIGKFSVTGVIELTPNLVEPAPNLAWVLQIFPIKGPTCQCLGGDGGVKLFETKSQEKPKEEIIGSTNMLLK